jgi:hypothetical protein
LTKTLRLEASDSSGQPLESVRLNLQGGTPNFAFFPGNADVTNKTYNYVWDTENVADGDYTLIAVAKDKSGLSDQTSVSFHVNNTKIPPSPATVEFLYSNAVAQSQAVKFLTGPISKVSARVSNAVVDPANIGSASLQVYAIKDGEMQLQAGSVRINGNSVEFLGTIPENARVHSVLRVLDTTGELILQSDDMASAMSAERGGTVWAAADGMLQLRIPAHALSEDALVEVSTISINSSDLAGAQTPAGQLSQLEVVYGPLTIQAQARTTLLERFQTPSILVFQRPAAEMSPLDAGRIDRAERYDSVRHVWSSIDDRSSSLAGTDVPQNRIISAAVVTLGIYRIAAIPKPGDGVTELIAYPSPLRAGSEDATIAYLLGDNADTELTIYDVLGNVVRRYNFASGSFGGQQFNQVVWDGRNGRGDLVANGAYIVQVTSTGHRARTKIGVAK